MALEFMGLAEAPAELVLRRDVVGFKIIRVGGANPKP